VPIFFLLPLTIFPIIRYKSEQINAINFCSGIGKEYSPYFVSVTTRSIFNAINSGLGIGKE